MLEISGQTAGKYLIMERVGHGGMSAIYKALDTTTDEVVALKVLSAAMASDPTFEARFSREIEVLRSLDHPHILPILDYGEIRGLPFIVMPFYEHGTLKDAIDRGLSPEDGMKIIEQIASALDYAHARGITHRDVKPSNILLEKDGSAVLSDFGFAHMSDSSLSLTGSSLLGTPAYMSPEQCRGEEINGSSDQYSLAVVIFEMVTGKPPFEAETPMSLVFKHLNDPVPSPREINLNVPEEVEDVLLKALHKDRNRRYTSIAAFNHALQIAVAPQLSQLSPGEMRRQKVGNQFRRFGRRISRRIENLRRSPRFMRSFRIGVTVAILIAFPMVYWAVVALGLGGSAGAGSGIDPTIVAQMEQTLAAGGARLSADELATALQATIESMGADETPTATVEPTATETPTPTPTPTETPDPWFYPTVTPDLGPSATPVPTVYVSALRTPPKSQFISEVEGTWYAEVTITIKQSDGPGAQNAIVTVSWSVSGTGVDSECTTAASGTCTVFSGVISSESTLMRVENVEHTWDYVPSNNAVTQITVQDPWD
jgi:serine/threonine protein kinase